ncbi:hypothetical protein [Streptomyces sp. NPDC054842]
MIFADAPRAARACPYTGVRGSAKRGAPRAGDRSRRIPLPPLPAAAARV